MRELHLFEGGVVYESLDEWIFVLIGLLYVLVLLLAYLVNDG
jgi:hypothetical protein